MFYKGQKLKLAKPLKQRNSLSIWTIPAGEIIEIQQVDEDFHKVLVNNVWTHVSRIEDVIERLPDESAVYGNDCPNGRCEV